MSTTLHAPGLVLTGHEFRVPLDHAAPDGEQITVFAREVADPQGGERPFLVFLQGGPGHEAPRPTRGPTQPGWLDRALSEFRVLMLDQRGTGRSTPIGVLPGLGPREQADRLALFRADAIVQDAGVGSACARRGPMESAGAVLRRVLRAQLSVDGHGVAPRGALHGWSASRGRAVDDIYRATYATMLERNRRYFWRYPGDRDRVLALHEMFEAGEVSIAERPDDRTVVPPGRERPGDE